MNRIFKGAVFFLGCMFLMAAYVPAAEEAEGTYTLNGEELEPYAIRELRQFRLEDPGVLVDIDRHLTLLLDQPGEYHFVQSTNEANRVYRQIDGNLKLVGIILGGNQELEPSDNIRDLRGICLIGNPTQNQLDVLNRIDPEKTFVRYVLPHEWKKTSYMPLLNPLIRFLHVDSSGSSPNDVDISSITNLVNLEFLKLEKDLGEPVDLRLIQHCIQLKVLDLTMQNLEHLESLAALKELRSLDLSRCDELTTIDFVERQPQLRKLYLLNTPVRTLAPIVKLQHLEYVDARGSAVEEIPMERMPALTALRLMASNVDGEAADQFQALNPQCAVSYNWNNSLQTALDGVDRIRIRSGGTCHNIPEEETTLFETVNTNEIAEFRTMLLIDQEHSDFHCMCCGNPTFEFYRGDELLVSLGFHHGRSVRWPGGEWPGDGLLTGDAAEGMIEWLDHRGVTGPKREVEESLRQQKEFEEAWSRWSAAIPKAIRPFYQQDGQNRFSKDELAAMNSALEEDIPSIAERIRALLEWYGSGVGPWSPCYAYENVPEDLLFKYDTEEVLSALNGSKMSEAQIEGAARFLGGWSFSVRRPDDRKLISPQVKKMLLEHCLKSDNDDKRGRATNAFSED